jgi:hypothetical protein
VTNTSKAKTKETEVNEKQLKQESTLPSLLAEYSAAPDTGHTEEQETSYTNQDHLRRRRESEKLREEEEREKQNQKQRDRIEVVVLNHARNIRMPLPSIHSAIWPYLNN